MREPLYFIVVSQINLYTLLRGMCFVVVNSGSSLLFMLNQQTRCQDNILLTQKFRKFLKP
ncbi:hypothetical protein B1L04_20485 [Microcystis aeruginosa KW]|uniref:Uncharacterized protein n=1 Tax=Microcystis aeruginosa KW TaxID=1960155 RepID=A0A1V4BLK1_MICAE|nr:hypothetical protein B1L04_20485 [Microcystis aeruginosa KW]